MHSKTSTALLLAALAGTLQAASLGDLQVDSRSGEPLDAVLEIQDVDLSISPITVRVAPPDIYQREGVAWPEAAKDLYLSRDTTSSQGVKVRVLGRERVEKSFPLLIELNVGGAVSLRRYEIELADGSGAAVRPASETTKLTPPPAAAKPAETAQKAEKAEKAEKAKSAPKPAAPAPRKRSAPDVVRDYVRINGFDANEPFHVQRDMTIWSVASLYWPSYEGSTLEQLIEAFRNRNPKCFTEGDPGRIEVGSTLQPPTIEEVLAVNAEEAFRAIHGAGTAVPYSTRNLMEAQSVSDECAREVARVQNKARAAGRSAQTIAEQGRRALEACKARIIEARGMNGEERAGAPVAAPVAGTAAPQAPEPAQTPAGEAEPSLSAPVDAAAQVPDQVPAVPEAAPAGAAEPASASAPAPAAVPSPEAAGTEGTTEASAPEPAQPEAGEKAAPEEKPEPAPAAEPAAVETKAPAADPAPVPVPAASKSPAPSEGFFDRLSTGLIGILLVVLAFLAGYFLKRKKAEEAKDEGTPKIVALSPEVPPSTEAQLKAVDAAGEAAAKAGTTAGALGAGALAMAAAEEEKKTPDDQPWLDPDADELPPLDAEEPRSTETDPEAPSVAKIMKGVTLDLEEIPEDQKTEEPQAAESAPKEAQEAQEAGNSGVYGFHRPTEKEMALWKALDAKMRLANSFIRLGAKDEALELVEEVIRQGSSEQKQRALFLKDKIRGMQPR